MENKINFRQRKMVEVMGSNSRSQNTKKKKGNRQYFSE